VDNGMTHLGSTARLVRERLGMTQREAADRLGVSQVHLSNVERGVSPVSASLITRFNEVFGVDVYVLSYCSDEVDSDAPTGVREARQKLAEALLRQLENATRTG
jgi:transcriptional regulator with XRE-family HTH domain